jgi:hypothetical protein
VYVSLSLSSLYCTSRSTQYVPSASLTYQVSCRWKSEVNTATIHPAIVSPGACRALPPRCHMQLKAK